MDLPGRTSIASDTGNKFLQDLSSRRTRRLIEHPSQTEGVNFSRSRTSLLPDPGRCCVMFGENGIVRQYPAGRQRTDRHSPGWSAVRRCWQAGLRWSGPPTNDRQAVRDKPGRWQMLGLLINGPPHVTDWRHERTSYPRVKAFLTQIGSKYLKEGASATFTDAPDVRRPMPVDICVIYVACRRRTTEKFFCRHGRW